MFDSDLILLDKYTIFILLFGNYRATLGRERAGEVTSTYLLKPPKPIYLNLISLMFFLSNKQQIRARSR